MSRALILSAPARRAPLAARLIRHALLVLTLRRERRQLGRLDPHLLADIGLSDRAARAEAARPIWDAPERWRS